MTPAAILISEGSANPAARAGVERIVASASSPDVDARLLSQPPNGTRNGNRNWLLHHVDTEFALLLDDDIDVAPEFLADALERMRRDEALAVVTGTSQTHPEPVWLRHRGFFRPARAGEPIAINTQLSLWRTAAYRSLWHDEAILYGFEEADLALRLNARGMKIVASAFPFVDRCAYQTVRYSPAERDDLAEQSRCYVAAPGRRPPCCEDLAEDGGRETQSPKRYLRGLGTSSYLATLEPERAGTRFRPRGWTVLANAGRFAGGLR